MTDEAPVLMGGAGHESDGKARHDTKGALPLRDRELFNRLRRTNLNLLPILAAVLETRRIGQAARELNLTQPAVSQALRQLRVIFEDELIVMAGRVPTITERASQILPPLRQILASTDRLLSQISPFDPNSEALTARIVTADYVSSILTPALLSICQPYEAEHRIEFVGVDMKRMQDLAQVDMVILPRQLAQRLGKTNGSMPLFQDRIVCIAAKDNPLPGRLSAEEIRACPQLRFSLEAHFPMNTHHLLTPAADLENAAAWSFEDYTALSLALTSSERIAVVPETLARWIARFAELRIIEVEGPPRLFAVDAIWSAELENQRGHRWLCEIVELASKHAANAFGAAPESLRPTRSAA